MSDEVADHLRSAIISKRLQPGTFIRLHDTAAQLGVSITPVREALLKLSNEGLVRREPHRGYVVLAVTKQDMHDICWLQDTIAAELAATNAHRIAHSHIEELQRINDRLVVALTAGNAKAMASAEASFQEILGRASGRTVLARFLLHAQRYLRAQIEVSGPERMRAVVDSNRRLIVMLRAGDAAAACPSCAEARLLEPGSESVIASAQGRHTSANADPTAVGPPGDAEFVEPQDKTIGIGQLRSDTLSYFERVAEGATMTVIRRGKKVARIVPERRQSRMPDQLPESAPNVRRSMTVPVALDALRTLAGRYLDRVAAGETLAIIQGGQIIGLVVSPEPE